MVSYLARKAFWALGTYAGKKVIGAYGKPGGWKFGGRTRGAFYQNIPSYSRRKSYSGSAPKPGSYAGRSFSSPMPRKRYPKKRRVRGWRRGSRRVGGYYGRYNKYPTRSRAEWKFHDLTVNTSSQFQSTGVVVASMNLIPQGTTERQRIGRKCTVRAIDWRYDVGLATSISTDADDVVRIILFVDRQANGATAAVLDILETADYQQHYNLANRGRFRFLMDRTISIAPVAAGGNGTSQDSFVRHIAGRFTMYLNLPIEFNSTTGALGEIRSNNIGVLFISKSSNRSDFRSFMRLRFTG